MSAAGIFSRVLSLAGDDPAEAGRLRVFRIYLMLHAPFELLWDSLVWESQRAYYGVAFGCGLLACLGLSFIANRTVLAVRLFCGFHLAAIVWLFPTVSNHFFLVFYCLLLLSILDLDRPREALLGLQACRWLTLVLFFYTGVQKLLYGTYFHAQFLSWTIAHDDRFSAAFGMILPPSEAQRLAALAESAGPFGSEWWPLVAISNFVYLFELIAPVLLLYRPTRSAAIAATVVFLVAIEIGAHEYYFARVVLNTLFLLTRKSRYKVLLPLTFVVYAYLLVDRLQGMGWP